MSKRKIIYGIIILVCVVAIGYAIYYQVFVANAEEPENEIPVIEPTNAPDFDSLFDNKLNYQNYDVSGQNKIDPSRDIVFTNYSLNHTYEGKYSMSVNIPIINIRTDKIINIDKEISAIFKEKVQSIIDTAEEDSAMMIRYTVDYTAYVNENILSVVIRSNLKEGSNAQRVIIQSYTYNLSTDEQISLSNMFEMKGIDSEKVEAKVKRVVQEGISRTEDLRALGYNVYERDINSTMYKVRNSNNYFLGPDGAIYIIYAYGNSNPTSEKDIVVVE